MARPWGWICLLALLIQACATAGSAGGLGLEEEFLEEGEGDRRPPWETGGPEEDEEARRAEAEAAVAGMRGVASHVEETGVEVAFHFWVQNGALTLLSWKRGAGGASRAGDVDSFVPGLEAHMPTYVGTRTGGVVFTLRRERQGWRLHSFSTADDAKPLEAKTLPVRRTGVTADTLAQAHAVASQLANGLRVPEGGGASLVADVKLDDDRILGASTVRYESRGGSPSREPSPGLVAQITQAILPLTAGVGPRTVRLKLEADHHRAESHARWRVMEAETLRPEPRAPPELVAEHYALYERILRQWREETKASVQEAGAIEEVKVLVDLILK